MKITANLPKTKHTKRSECALCSLTPGESAVIQTLSCPADMKQRLTDLGFIVGTRVTLLRRAFLGDPCAYYVRGSIIALRDKDAAAIACGAQEAE